MSAIDETQPFAVECDASDVAVSATLNRNGRPVAFMSRTLGKSELNYPSIEKEATAVVEALRKWQHLLLRSHFTLVMDQRSIAFMFDNRMRSKIKNSKIQCWRVELADFSYSISYRPGVDNVAHDAFTQAYCAEIHKPLCHLA